MGNMVGHYHFTDLAYADDAAETAIISSFCAKTETKLSLRL